MELVEMPRRTIDSLSARIQNHGDASRAAASSESPATIHELFEGRAAERGDATALVYGDERVSYADLDARANRIARHLVERGAGAGRVVGIFLDRNIDLPAVVLGVLKTGSAFTMLDTEFPMARLAAVASQSTIRLVITTGKNARCWDNLGVFTVSLDEDTGLIEAHDPTPPPARVDPADPAVVMFTSGSSGEPKGILAPHRAVTATLTGQTYVNFNSDEVWLQCAPVSWDAFLLELFGPLLSGALCVLQPGARPDPVLISEIVATHRISTLHVAASLLNVLVDEHREIFATVRQIMTGGEAASHFHIKRLLTLYPHLRVVNGYSPAECMIFTLCHPVTLQDAEASSVPVGLPIVGKHAYVLDDNLDPVPPGVPGEVYMTGGGLAHGYITRAGLTAQRFVADPHGRAGERMYRTGDLAKCKGNGVIEFIGRADDQVKIRGFRIEPAEIEALMARVPGVARAKVIVREDSPGDKRLVAYFVSTGQQLDLTDLRAYVAQSLPEYMIPAAFIQLGNLPLTPNGKVDRRALPAPDYASMSKGREARTAQEITLCKLFAQTLKLGHVTIDDNFFDLGGHSLLATRLVSRVRAEMGAELQVREVFRNPTVASLSSALAVPEEVDIAVVPLRDRSVDADLSFAQRRLWFLDQLAPGSAEY
ncbi:amino acid adenylation domain-containing protein, partial [Streptomyces sp. NPDC021218]|uniref:amino acid adenylation domain-containing protein n=1 Tax=Streptomyces sp. NPDC021218 TaxID=3365119 RepID=UPI0037888980